MTKLEEYYNKFNEEKRLLRPYGRVEYLTTMKYIEEGIAGRESLRILDVGAGTGRYAVPLSELGHEVTAVELVNYNLGILKKKGSSVIAKRGNALNLSKYPSDHFDIVFELGPLYHLFSFEEKLQVLKEAQRVAKPGGLIYCAYCMNEFSVLTYGFKEGHVKEALESGSYTEDFQSVSTEENLYSYVRIEEINALQKASGLSRVKLLASDGPANYMRQTLKEMDPETFSLFMDYHFATCERPELLGASGHTLDILRK